MAKNSKRKNLIPFNTLSDEEKQSVVFYIQRNGVSIRQAALDLHMTTGTINRIYTEKFGKKERELDEIKNQINNNIKKI